MRDERVKERKYEERERERVGEKEKVEMVREDIDGEKVVNMLIFRARQHLFASVVK